MTNFTVLTDEQIAHDAATSKRYLEALREVGTENARLRAHIKKCANAALGAGESAKSAVAKASAFNLYVWHLAALGETK